MAWLTALRRLQDSEPFQEFLRLCIRAFLAVRQHTEDIVALVRAAAVTCAAAPDRGARRLQVASMADSGLPCYMFADTISKLRARFLPGATDAEAALFMKSKVRCRIMRCLAPLTRWRLRFMTPPTSSPPFCMMGSRSCRTTFTARRSVDEGGQSFDMQSRCIRTLRHTTLLAPTNKRRQTLLTFACRAGVTAAYYAAR